MKKIPWIVLFTAAAQFLLADGTLPGGRISMPVLSQNGSARAMAIGSAYVSVAEDSASLMWNPAGLAGLDEMELGIHHNSGLAGSTQEIILIGIKNRQIGGFAASVSLANNGLFEERDSLGNLTGTDTAGSMGFNLGWGRQWFPGFSAGISVKANKQSLAGREYDSIAADAGIIWKILPLVNAGAAYYNFNIIPGRANLSSGLRAGISLTIGSPETNSLLIALATEIQSGGIIRSNVGIEDTILKIFAVRLGYVMTPSNPESEGLTGLTVGLGFKVQDIRLDYACIPFDSLGTSNRFSLTYEFTGVFETAPVKNEYTVSAISPGYIPKPDALKMVVFEDVRFEFDSADLSEEAIRIIRRNIRMLKEHPKIKVLIEGHACKIGSEAFNVFLSLLRAQSIKDFILKDGGISSERVGIIGYGDKRPVTYEYIPEDINSDAAKLNRRGVFNILVE